MSYTYHTGTERGSGSYMKYRARLGIDTSDGTSTHAVIKWIGQAQSTQISGYGIKVSVSSSGNTSGYSGSKSGSDTGVVSSSKSFETDASTSGTLKIPRGHDEKKVKVTATVSGATVSGHSGVPWGDSTASDTITISALTKYTVRYDANGGTGAPDSQTKWYGETLKLRTTKPTRTGYTFVGWGLSASDTAKNYDPGDSYTKNSGDTLYAIWKPISYTITYNANGGKNTGSTTQTKQYGKSINLFEGSYFSRTGYTLIRWSTSKIYPDASATVWSLGGSYTRNASDTLYAVWRKQLVLSYNANGGEGAPASDSTYVYNSVTSSIFQVSKTVPKRAGYTFLGWSTSKTATSASYQPSSTITISSSTTLYAVWKASTTTATFYTYNQNGVYTSNVRSVIIGGAQTVTYPDIVGKYSLIGWYPAKKPPKEVYPYSQETAPTQDGVIATNNVTVPTASSNKIFYGVYRDISPSSITIKQSGCSRVAADSDFSTYKNDIINGEQPQDISEDTNTLFGYFELSSSATALSSINLTLTPSDGGGNVSGTFTTSISGNRLFFKFVSSGSGNPILISKIYTVSMESIDTSGKPISGSIRLKKKTQLIDITKDTIYVPNSYTYSSKNSSGVSRSLIRYNSNNNLIIGGTPQTSDYGTVSSGSGGNTVFYGHDILFYTGSNGVTSRAGYFASDRNLYLDGKVKNLYKVITAQFSTGSIASNGYVAADSRTYSGVPSGYEAVGIVGVTSSHNAVRPTTYYVVSNTSIHCGYRNEGTSANSATITFHVLCLKGTSA